MSNLELGQDLSLVNRWGMDVKETIIFSGSVSGESFQQPLGRTLLLFSGLGYKGNSGMNPGVQVYHAVPRKHSYFFPFIKYLIDHFRDDLLNLCMLALLCDTTALTVRS